MQHISGRPARARSLRRIAAAAVAALGIVALTACSSARSETGQQEATGAPVDGGTVTFAVALDAIPSGVFRTLETNYPWLHNVFEPLMLVDPDDPANPEPVLATEWALAEDSLSIDITLREGVTFHSGRPMTAEDVKYTFEQAADPASGSQLRFVPGAFTELTAVDDTRLHIAFETPQPSLFDFFSQTPIIDQETAAGLEDGTQVVGTGPFAFTDWKPGASFTLEKYDDYWAADDVHLDSIEYVVTTDATALLSAIRSGRADLAMGLTATDAQSFAEDPQYQVLRTGGTFYTFGMNTTVPPFDDVRVRQAVAYAIDRERINTQVLSGIGEISDLYWDTDTPGVDESLVTHYSYDPEKARQLIEEAGATGASVPIAFHGNPVVKAMYEVVANNLTEIGLVPQSGQVDQPTFQERQIQAELGTAWLQNNGQGGLSPVTMLSSMPTLRLPNASKFETPEYDAVRSAMFAATTDEDRKAAIQDLSAFLNEQQFVAPIIRAPSSVVATAGVQGIEFSPRGPVMLGTAHLTE